MISVIEGQLSIFDIPTITPKEEVKKVIDPDKNTDDEIINRYKDIAVRIVKCFGGRYCVETEKEEIVCYKNGKEDYRGEWINFDICKLRALLPMDEILFAKHDFKVNYKQEQILEEFKKARKVEKVIKRFGDSSYIVITSDSKYGVDVHVINPKGWIVDYINMPIYKNNEVVFQNDIEEFKDSKEEIKNDGEEIQLGSNVRVNYHNKEYIGKVVKIYGPSNKIANVIFNGMHSAFYMDHVQKVDEVI
ncbi:hypothetical protein [uncultured Clostridium sp.]|uniref:hypothetical protein n=1 Tax=uncultured Clostridium sp. TaxID=59620 RepID=UPI0025D5C966|nr:hypothetical protein [uncultured Clostridium sp.]